MGKLTAYGGGSDISNGYRKTSTKKYHKIIDNLFTRVNLRSVQIKSNQLTPMKTPHKTPNQMLLPKTPSLRRLCLLTVAASIIGLGGTAQAVVVGTNSYDNVNPIPVSATDLIDSSQATLLSQTPIAATTLPSFNPPASNYGQLNDGVTGGSFGEGVSNGANPYTVTFTLNTSVNSFGYDITGVNTFAASYGFAGIGYQDYELLYSVVGDTNFISLGSFGLNSDSNNDY